MKVLLSKLKSKGQNAKDRQTGGNCHSDFFPILTNCFSTSIYILLPLFCMTKFDYGDWLVYVRTSVRPCVSACVQLVSFFDKLLRKIICNNIWLTCSLYWFTSLSVSNRNRYLHAASSYERILPVHDTVQGNVLPPIFLVHLTSNNHCRFQNGEKGRHYLICLNIFLFSRWFG